MESPLVTVICLCYNHSRFVQDAIRSVLQQTYRPVQLIVVDDASTDNSVQLIQETLKDEPSIAILCLKENLGNCRAFNKGFELATGDFVIDLAADDVLMPNRIAEGLQSLSLHGEEYGVHFSDAELITEDGKHVGYHSDRFPHGSIPQGDIYLELIARYFINSPTMMMRRSVFEKLGGYDPSLAYEDFDFWIRSAREFKYCYTPETLIKRRIVKSSMSRNQYQPQSIQMASTLKVIEKIFQLNRTDGEKQALSNRIRYEMKRAFELREWRLFFKYSKLLIRNAI